MKIQAKAFLNIHDLRMLVENYNSDRDDRIPLPRLESKIGIVNLDDKGRSVQYITFDAESDRALQGI